MKSKAIVASIAALVLSATIAVAQPRPGAGPGPGHGPGDGPGAQGEGPLVEFLQLTDAQRESWTGFHEEFRTAAEPLFEQQKALHEQLRTALDSGADAAAVGQIMITLHANRNAIESLRAQLEQNLRSVLTAEQVVRYEAFRAAQQVQRRGPGQGQGPGQGPGAGRGAGGGRR